MSDPWWRGAAVYQVYIRSFADGNADGIGDIPGLHSRLGYLSDLGVDAVWISPWYVSPMVDAGYDVTDYRDIDPTFGTLRNAEAFIDAAHHHGLRVIVDMVPNHCSAAHPWFRAALSADPGSAERQRFYFRPGKGTHGELPPNDWTSGFGGPAWSRVTEPDGVPGEWYLHLYAPEQPDFNWDNPEVRSEFLDILRFWLDRGVDGFRIDAADRLAKDPALPDVAAVIEEAPGPERGYPAAYHAPGELHTSFSLDLMCSPWDGPALRAVIDANLESSAATGTPLTWVLGNHDATRVVTRYGREDTRFVQVGGTGGDHGRPAGHSDHALGTRRARAAALLIMALPGGLYLYQGDELGLWEVEDIAPELIADPVWERSGHTDRGRDGCRVPLPWSGSAAPFGFSPDHADSPPWLPQPAAWRSLTAAAQSADPDSTLGLYRAALRIRRAEPGLGDGPLTWLPSGRDVLAFGRPGEFACAVNLSAGPIELPAHRSVVLTSGPLAGGLLPPDTAAWLRAD